ncbi:MAG: site-specific integrase [Gemmataceae bacterium]|nr:site-specific integrase [Gemmataceae bacterium]
MAGKRRGRGEGSIRFNPAKQLWEVQLSLGCDPISGKRRRETAYAPTKKEAQEKLLELQQQALDGRLDAPEMNTRACLEFWLGAVKNNVAPNTYDHYKSTVDKHLTPYLGKIKLADLTAFHVAQLYRDLEAAGASADARRRAGGRLRQCLRYAVNFGLIPTSAAHKIPLPRVSKAEIHPLDQDEARALLDAGRPDRLFALYQLALDSGARQGEMFALQWTDFIWDRREVSISKSLEEIRGRLRVKEPKSASGRRRVLLTPTTLTILREHQQRMLAEGHGSALVFCDRQGGHLRKSNVQRRSFQPLLKRAGLMGVRFHDLRHTCATLLLLAGVNIKVVSERLGHADVKITLDTYSHVLPTMQELAVEKLDALLSGPTPAVILAGQQIGSRLAADGEEAPAELVGRVVGKSLSSCG